MLFFLFINELILSLFSCLPVQGTPSLVGTKQREETQMRDEYLFLSFSLSLYLFTLHFNSCHRSVLSQWEFTIWHSGFWGSIKYIKKNSLTKHQSTGCHVAFVNLLHVSLFPLILPFYRFIKYQSIGALYLKEVPDLLQHDGFNSISNKSSRCELEGQYKAGRGRKQHINI